jgi:hypothetical protein
VLTASLQSEAMQKQGTGVIRQLGASTVLTLLIGNADSDHLPVFKTKVNPKVHETHRISAGELGCGLTVGILHIINR